MMYLSHIFVIGYHNVLVLVASTYHVNDVTYMCFCNPAFLT